jgi:adenylate cyclase
VRFRDRLLLAVWLLLAGVLGLTFLLVRQANLRQARRAVDADLQAGAVLFDQLVRGRLDQLALGARLLSHDWAFRQLYGSSEDPADPVRHRTLLSGLENYRARLPEAAFLLLVSLDDEVLADTSRPDQPPRIPFAHPWLLRQAEAAPEMSATAFAPWHDQPALLLAVPIQIPEPAGWIVVGFALDAPLADGFRQLAGLDVTFLQRPQDGPPRLIASTLPAAMQPALTNWSLPSEALRGVPFAWLAGGTRWIGLAHPLPGDGRTSAVLQRDLERELAPHRRLEHTLLLLTIGALALSALLAAWLAAGISRPVSDLVQGVGRIAEGNYQQPVQVRRADELGQLGAAFNQMAAGLAERDRVRDLLGKAVSPAIAAELLRRPPVLGGEEREVTVLFTDLRSFTRFSETVTPTALVEVLNDYFTRITGVVEAHGGIVDKFIGDAVMAVFGAPVAQTDHARRALDCALAILRELDAWNAARRSAGQPELATGVGVATGRVVAGNLGSASRHNYTVMGDAANLAARLQDLTKEYGERGLVAAETVRADGGNRGLRRVGEVPVRGKAAPTEVFALESKPAA